MSNGPLGLHALQAPHAVNNNLSQHIHQKNLKNIILAQHSLCRFTNISRGPT